MEQYCASGFLDVQNLVNMCKIRGFCIKFAFCFVLLIGVVLREERLCAVFC